MSPTPERAAALPEESRFQVVFDGDPLDEGAMDVADLAPALLGLADVVDEINKAVTRGEAVVVLRVRAGFPRGSFGIDFEIVQSIQREFIDFFSSREVQAWATFFSLLGVSGFGVLQLIKRARGRRPRTVVDIEQSTRVRVLFEGDSSPVEIEKRLWSLFNTPRVRAGLARLVLPLRRDGMRKILFQKPGCDPVEIEHGEAPFFAPVTEHEGELVTESERVLRIIGVSFKEGNKWRVSEGNSSFHVSIADEEFAHRVENGVEKFGANDLLKVILRTRQWYEGVDLKSSYEIAQLLEHIEGEADSPALDL